jgi:hypothetical protein
MDLRGVLCDLVNRCIAEINDGDDIKAPIKEKILKPIINYILDQIYPYLIISVCIFVLTLLVAIIILVLIIKTSYSSNAAH